MSSFVDSINNLANTVVYNSALNTQANLSVDFINKFGSYSNNFSEITPLGSSKNIWYYVLTGVFIFISIGLAIFKKKEEIDVREQPDEKKEESFFDKPLTKLFYISILLTVALMCYSLYKYFFIYKPQYNKWYASLPNEARNILASINTVRELINTTYNRRPTYTYNSPSFNTHTHSGLSHRGLSRRN